MKKLIAWIFSRFNRTRKTKGVTDFNDIKLSISKDKPDKRDYLVTTTEFVALPTSLDYSEYVTVKQQGSIGSCGSHAAATGLEMLQNLHNYKWNLPLSELYHYWVVRQKTYNDKSYMGTFPEDSGQTGRTSMAVMLNVGICPENLMPYLVSKFNDNPGQFCESFARWWRIKRYSRCLDISDIKVALNDKKAVWLGIPVQLAIWSNKGDILDYTVGNKIYGGHALTVVGYDDRINALKVVNSWGRNWGNKGFGYISYSYLEKCPWFDCWCFEI